MATCPRDQQTDCLSPGPIDGGCCRITPRDRPLPFSVYYRNPGHWDVTTKWGRAFRIRGAPGVVRVSDERQDASGRCAGGWLNFATVADALAFIAAQLMHEPGHP